jgi:hypothetical protein
MSISPSLDARFTAEPRDTRGVGNPAASTTEPLVHHLSVMSFQEAVEMDHPLLYTTAPVRARRHGDARLTRRGSHGAPTRGGRNDQGSMVLLFLASFSPGRPSTVLKAPGSDYLI